ncbi:MAG: hypothetical protein RSA29_16890 [Clostridium sp.]|uniref:hypothetical protein n=1 Tax=Clostridium sp. TaxID=1506 RepID=UPI003053D823
MKVLIKAIALISALLLAVNFAMPKVDMRTKRKMKKTARKLQHRAGDMLSIAMSSLK